MKKTIKNKKLQHHYKKFVKHHFNKHHSTKKKYHKSSLKKNKKDCKEVTTADPRVFGPELWRSLHRIAQNYPYKPSLVTQKNCKNFLQSLPYMTPCSHCGCAFLLYLNKKNIKETCSSKDKLVEFLVRAHNRVSENLDPKKNNGPLKKQIKHILKRRFVLDINHYGKFVI